MNATRWFGQGAALRAILIGVIVTAVAVPGLARVPGVSATPASALPDAFPRIHADEASTADAQAAARAWLADFAARRESRPAVDPAAQSQRTAAWTVMVFIAGDNNLEGAGLFDMNEMEAIGSSSDVNIVVEVDRSADYDRSDGDWSGARRYYIQQDDDLDHLKSPVMAELGRVNSGDAGAVADFAIWGISNYPAEKYMLVLWDHGGAWISHSSDEDTGDDMTLPELLSALDRVKATTGVQKFEVLGFDMCLMGQLEVFQAVAPYANYGVGSQENEPGAGWFYVFLDELVRNPSIDGARVAQYGVEYYVAFFREIYQGEPQYGLSAYDLSQSQAIASAVNTFAQAVRANPQAALSAIGDARNNTLAFGGFDDPRYYDVWSSVDLYGFAQVLRGLRTTDQVQAAATGLMTAVDDFVIYHDQDGLDGANGLSIYFPRNVRAYEIGDFNQRYPAEVPSSMAPWVDFINVFHGTATATVTTPPSVKVIGVYPEVASIYDPAVVTMEVSGRDILQVTYAVALIEGQNQRVVLDYDELIERTTTDDGEEIVNWSDGVTSRSFTWEADVPVLTDGTNTTYALLIPSSDKPNVAVVNGMYTPGDGSKTIEAQMLFNLETRRSTALWGINETASGAIQPFEIRVGTGDTFTPLWLTLDDNNQLSGSRLSNVTLRLVNETNITFDKVPAPSGDYAISFVAQNIAAQTALDEAIIKVNNEGLDPAFRGYTDLTYGVTFRYPANWIRPRLMDDGRLFTGDLATNTLLSLYPYTDVRSAAETDAAIRASWSQLTGLNITNERQREINGVPAYVTDYTYSYRGENRIGAVIALYVADKGVGFGFDLDAPASNPEQAQVAVQELVASIKFFGVQDVTGESAWQTAAPPDSGVTFPVPADWVQDSSGGWTLYGPANDTSIFVGLTWEAASGQSNEQLAQYWYDQLASSLTNFKVLSAEPFYIGGREWALVIFTYQGAVPMQGAFFVTSAGGRDYTIWIEAPQATFEALAGEVFTVVVGGFAFQG